MKEDAMPPFLQSDEREFESAAGAAVNNRFLADEAEVVTEVLDLARLPATDRAVIRRDAMQLVAAARGRREGKSGIEAFLQQYDLASQEGIVLMCLAEALLRIPDADTADRLIADKISTGSDAVYAVEAFLRDGKATGESSIEQIARAWERWAEHPDGVIIIVAGEVIARK